jgi:hypothetical protein
MEDKQYTEQKCLKTKKQYYERKCLKTNRILNENV